MFLKYQSSKKEGKYANQNGINGINLIIIYKNINYGQHRSQCVTHPTPQIQRAAIIFIYIHFYIHVIYLPLVLSPILWTS